MASESEIVIQGSSMATWFALACFSLVGWVIRASLNGLKEAVKSAVDGLKKELADMRAEFGERIGVVEDAQQSCQVGLARDLGLFVRREDYKRDVDQLHGRITSLSEQAAADRGYVAGVKETLAAWGRERKEKA